MKENKKRENKLSKLVHLWVTVTTCWDVLCLERLVLNLTVHTIMIGTPNSFPFYYYLLKTDFFLFFFLILTSFNLDKEKKLASTCHHTCEK